MRGTAGPAAGDLLSWARRRQETAVEQRAARGQQQLPRTCHGPAPLTLTLPVVTVTPVMTIPASDGRPRPGPGMMRDR